MARKFTKSGICKRSILPTLLSVIAAAGITFSSRRAENYTPGTIREPSIHPLLAKKLEEIASSSLFDLTEVQQGTINEDSPDNNYRRSFHHFQHWETGEGIYGFSPVKEWAQNGPAQEGYPFGDHSWNKTKEEYANGTIGQSFGHIFHLISDLTVPAHARLDPHPATSEQMELFTLGLWTADAYEVWTHEQRERIMGSVTPGETPHFNTLGELFDSLAHFTGSNFYSDDLNVYQDCDWVSRRCSGDIDCTWEGKYCYREVEGTRIKILRRGFLWNFPDSQCLSDYWPILGTKAVEYGASALELLAREAGGRDGGTSRDAGNPRDAGTTRDAGTRDAGPGPDAGSPRDAGLPPDAGSRDAGVRDAGSRDGGGTCDLAPGCPEPGCAFYDDFSGSSLDTTCRWDYMGLLHATASEGNLHLKVYGENYSYSSYLHSREFTSCTSGNYILEFRVRTESYPTGEISLHDSLGGGGLYLTIRGLSGFLDCGGQRESFQLPTTGEWYTMRLERNNTTIRLLNNGQVAIETTSGNGCPFNTGQINTECSLPSSSNSNADCYFDYIKLRCN